MSENTFDINGTSFKLSKIDAFKQFHIVRRIAPILSDLVPAMSSIKSASKDTEELSESERLDHFAAIAAPVMSGLSKLSDQDADRVLFGLLSSVEMQQSAGNWARLATDKMLMIQNLDLPVLLQCAGRAFAYNLQSFFVVARQVS